MDNVIVYVSYDSYVYQDYYHLIFNETCELKYRSKADLDEIMQMIHEKVDETSFAVYLVQDDTHMEAWEDYVQVFQNHQISLHEAANQDDAQVQAIKRIIGLQVLNKDARWEPNEKDAMTVLFYGKGQFATKTVQDDEATIEATIEAEQRSGDDAKGKMTELAKIIEKKYKRGSKSCAILRKNG